MTAPTPERQAFGARLQAARLRMGYTSARSFAEVLGVQENRYSRYERGEAAPKTEMLRRICEHLQVSPSDLYDWPVESKPNPSSSGEPGASREKGRGLREDASGYELDARSGARVARADCAAWDLATELIELAYSQLPSDLPSTRLQSTVRLSSELLRDPLPALAKVLESVQLERIDRAREEALTERISFFLELLDAAARLNRDQESVAR